MLLCFTAQISTPRPFIRTRLMLGKLFALRACPGLSFGSHQNFSRVTKEKRRMKLASKLFAGLIWTSMLPMCCRLVQRQSHCLCPRPVTGPAVLLISCLRCSLDLFLVHWPGAAGMKGHVRGVPSQPCRGNVVRSPHAPPRRMPVSRPFAVRRGRRSCASTLRAACVPSESQTTSPTTSTRSVPRAWEIGLRSSRR